MSHDVFGRTTTDMGWRRFSFLLKGTGRDQLTFRSLSTGVAGPALDEVSLVPNSVPETFAGLQIRKAVQLFFPTIIGKSYQVEWAEEAGASIWNLLGATIPGNGSTNVFTDPLDRPFRIYRVVQID